MHFREEVLCPDFDLGHGSAECEGADAAGATDDNYFEDYDHAIWVSSSSDGVTWSKAVNIPSDGNRDTTPPVSIASDSRGRTVLVTEDNGGNSGGVACGQPKLSRSSDLLRWTTCGLAGLGAPYFTASYPVVLFGGNDKLWVSFAQPRQLRGQPAGGNHGLAGAGRLGVPGAATGAMRWGRPAARQGPTEWQAHVTSVAWAWRHWN